MNQNASVLDTSVQFVKGVGPNRATLYEKLGVFTIRDLLFLFPREYQDLRNVTPLASLEEGVVLAVAGKLEYVRERVTRSGLPIIDAGFSDPTGYVSVTWFHRPWVADQMKLEGVYRLVGKAKLSDGRWKMANPRVELMDVDVGSPGLVPVYPLTEGLNIHSVRRAIAHAVEKYVELVQDPMPEGLRRKHGFPDLAEALRLIHAPPNNGALQRARSRMIYDDFLPLQTALAVKRFHRRESSALSIVTRDEVDRRIRRLFPFTLTGDQNQAISEITRDLASGKPMYRLLQGDVGTGKTAVAAYAMLATIAAGYQTALMAPTEILAQQHFRTFDGYLARSRVRRRLLTGSLSSNERAELLKLLEAGEIDLVVGTHALVQKDVSFARLGLAVIDEQHKFGVRQRGELLKQGQRPHQLVMTATPIPRSLAMTWFGDLDLSRLKERPPGRKETLTYVVPFEERDKAYSFLDRQLHAGSQGLVVCPRIDNDQDETLTAAVQRAEELVAGPFAKHGVGVVHGRLPDEERERVLQSFRNRELAVLVSTVVIEVGLDIPTANVVIIENAEQFGLSQLHQIRGRVGRGGQRGTCLLIHRSADPEVKDRLASFARTNDGFAIAELDAKIRGIGDAIGARQHGSNDLKIGDYVRDVQMLQKARQDAAELVRGDPSLASTELRPLRQIVLERYGKDMNLALIG
ncbi:MAG: ATP-dependent DNA helicase RecG [Planctomycetota bacterium]